jgi:hypothetical protein
MNCGAVSVACGFAAMGALFPWTLVVLVPIAVFLWIRS